MTTPRPCRLELRLTPEEFTELGRAAEQAHLSVSALVRVRLFGLGGEQLGGARKFKPVRQKREKPVRKPTDDYCPATSDHEHRYRPVSQLLVGGGELRTCNWCEWKEVLKW